LNKLHELGYFGNIWVRQNLLERAGEIHEGHKHNFDHVSLLARGKVRVAVADYEPKEFTAPTFIVIKKEYYHTFEALEDNTLWYCVFALRDIDGEVTDFYSGDNTSYGSADSIDRVKMLSVMEKTSQHK
jgi:hypothetical protein